MFRKEMERRMLLDGRSLDSIRESIERNKLYYEMDTIKIDTSDKGVDDVIDEIKNLMQTSNASSIR